MPAKQKRIVGIVGTFDVEDYGALLPPLIAGSELGRRLGTVELRQYSRRAMASPPWCYPVRSIDRLRAEIGELALLLVCGGHLAQPDRAVVSADEPAPGDALDPTDSWLGPILTAATAGVPVAWDAVGASPAPPTWAVPLLATAIDAADHVSARDAGAVAGLRAVAPSGPVHRVPDPAFGIRATLAARGPDWAASVRRGLGLDTPYVIVQPSPRLAPASAAIADAVRAVQAGGRRVIELPSSPAFGDQPGVLGFEADAVIEPRPAPMEIAAIVAGAEAVVADSQDLIITAIAHGVAALRVAATDSAVYQDSTRHEGVRTFRPESGELAELLVAARPAAVGPEALEHATELEAHWDRIAELVTTDDPAASDRRRAAIASLLERLPAILQAADERTRTAIDELAEATRRHEDSQRRLRQELVERDARLLEANAATQRLNRELGKASRELSRTTQKLDRKTQDLERLKRRRAVRAALRVSGVARGIVGLRRPSGPPPAPASPPAPVEQPRPWLPATETEEQVLLARLKEQLPRNDRREGPLVSIVVLTRDGRHHLERLIPLLHTTIYRSFELIVVDNASTDGTAAWLAGVPRSHPIELITNPTNRPFAEANNQGVVVAKGRYILLLNNDTAPVLPDWLGRLVTTLEERGAAAVGTRLIYPRRPDLDNQGDQVFPDLTLQHRGIAFVPADGVPVGHNLGSGSDPLSPEANDTREVPALTAACLLVDREAWDAVGGLTEGYMFGTEDVDLCLKLRANGGTLVYDGGVAVWHHEYGTQNAEGAAWKRDNRRANRKLFVDRWGPQLFREVMVDRLRGDRRWSEEPFHVGITVTRDDASAGWGDLYTARELGGACEALGWRVSYLERYRDRWYEPDPSIDVVVVLLDAFDIRRLPRHMATVAWVRSWTHRWLSQPWFDDYDIVFASSDSSRRLIESRSGQRARSMPLATNPARFARTAPVPALATDAVFTGNHWGDHRGVIDTLPGLDPGISLKVFGKGWEETPVAAYHQGPIAYERLPEVYSSARIVIDDTGRHTKPYGAVNSRVFDALAAGAIVVSDNEEGIRELFDDEFPIARDGPELARVVAELLGDPERAARLAARYRETVVERHTYAHRAAQLRDALLEWAQADRVSILIEAPSHDASHTGADHRFARDLQRQLTAQGLPTRLEIVPEWSRPPTARQDIVLHPFGLREHRARPSQVNLLWVVSHPDLVQPTACERYDHVFVASDAFAATLAAQVAVPVTPLHRATDPVRFHPDPIGPEHELLYVADAHGTRRRVVADLGPPTAEFAIYGRGWSSDLVDPEHVKGEYVPTDVLHRYYSSAAIVLNDHLDDMRSHGFIAGRLYDALASGAFVISDDVAGLDAEFDGGVVTYDGADHLRQLVGHYLERPEERRRIAERGHRAILARHTFAHRVTAMLDAVADLRGRHPRDLGDLAAVAGWLGRRPRRGRDRTPVGSAGRSTARPDQEPGTGVSAG